MPILHKRSLTSGSVPTTASLAVGQLAINVPDGRIFLRKSGSTDTIESAITTNAPNSGSVSLTGSLSITGSGTVFSAAGDVLEIDSDSVEVTGSFLVSGSTRLIGTVTVTGSVIATQGFTGSLFGTSSWATNALTASFVTASGVFGPFGSNSVVSASFAVSASTVPASGVVGLNLTQIVTGSVTASVSLTQFRVTSGSVTEFTVTGTGVTIGNALTDTHTVTGSLNITGSVTARGLTAGTGSGDVLMYNTSSGQFFYTASSTVGGAGGDSVGGDLYLFFNY